MNLTEHNEEVVEMVVQSMQRDKEEIDKAIPRPFGGGEVDEDTRLEKFHRALNPETLTALVKAYGRAAVVKEFRELYPKYMERIKGNGAQEAIPPGPPSPEGPINWAGVPGDIGLREGS